MKSLCEVYCLGNAVADVLARPVDGLAPSGMSQPLEDVLLAPGGNSINTAIALARLGVSVRICAAVGNDRFGQFIRDRVRAEGIDDTGLVTLPGAKTSASIVLVEASGERRFLHLRGVSAFFSGQNLDWEQVEGSRIFHYASAFALPAFDETSLEPALRRARELGCLTSLNICWDVRGRWLKTLQSALAHTDFIFPNRDEEGVLHNLHIIQLAEIHPRVGDDSEEPGYKSKCSPAEALQETQAFTNRQDHSNYCCNRMQRQNENDLDRHPIPWGFIKRYSPGV
jgi:sugar/nucleoside kinase (ribokinase family)